MRLCKRIDRRRFCLINVLTVLFLASSGSIALAEPRVRDVWYAFVDGDQRYGCEHVTVSKLPDGNFQYDVKKRLLVDFLGMKQEIKQRGRYVVSPTYQPVSFENETAGASGKLLNNGRVENGRLVMSFQRGGFKGTRTVDLSHNSIFAACLDDWLCDRPADLKSASVDLIDEQSDTMQPASARRGKSDRSGSLWQVNLGPLIGRGTLRYDARGLREETNFTTPNSRLVRSSADEAKNLRHRKMDGPRILMFPIDKNITAPQRLTSLKVALKWKNLPFEQFCLEDNRQRILQKKENDGRYRVVIEVTPSKLPQTDLKYPITGTEFEPYLAETRFIKPRDASIVAKAREWTQGTNTALEATRALCKHVFGFLNGGTMIAETLSGPEVLQCKQGKCSEFSTLFASLARSLGIPTRIVLGERMSGGSWVGHMWCEVYVGQWITVDASANEVAGSMSLLKLIHSDTVLGTQPVRWKLTDSLEIEIEDFQQEASPLAGKLKTGLDGRVYTNVDFACRVTFPGDGWTIKDKSKAGVMTVRFTAPKQLAPKPEDVQIHLVAFNLPAGIAPSVLTGARLVRFQQAYKDFEVLDHKEYKSDAIRGQRLSFRRTAKDQKKVITTEIVWIDGSFGYLLNIIAEEAAHDKCVKDFYKLLHSFETLKAK